MKMKEENDKADLKLNIHKTEINGIQSRRFMANVWGKNKNEDRLCFLGLRNQCRWWLKPVTAAMKLRCLLLGRQAMAKLDSILKSRDITLLTKVHLFKAMVCPRILYGCESWTTKNAEHQRINAFVLWCWGRLLRVLWTSRRSNKSIQKGINPMLFIGRTDAEAEAPGLWNLMQRSDSLEKTLMLGKIESMRRRRPLRMTWLEAIINSVYRSLSKLPGIAKDRETWHDAVYGSQRVRHD